MLSTAHRIANPAERVIQMPLDCKSSEAGIEQIDKP